MTNKDIDIKEFQEFGFLQEANRQFFHPLGLALSIETADDGTAQLCSVWDARDDPEGFLFGALDSTKADRVAELRASKLQARLGTGECGDSGIQRIRASSDE